MLVVEKLLEGGADLFLKDIEGLTPLDLAINSRCIHLKIKMGLDLYLMCSKRVNLKLLCRAKIRAGCTGKSIKKLQCSEELKKYLLFLDLPLGDGKPQTPVNNEYARKLTTHSLAIR